MRRFLHNKTASAALEFALCLPFLIGLVIGAEEFGRAFWCQHMLVQMTHDATRYLSRVSDPTSGTYQARATNLALYGNQAGSGQMVMPSAFGTGPVTLSYSIDTVGGTWVGVAQNVTATARFTFASTLIGWLGLDPNFAMTVAHTERVQSD